MEETEWEIDEEYLDKKFPKGETKFRGEAMVLLALAREVGKEEAINEFIALIDDCPTNYHKDYATGVQNTTIEVRELKRRLEIWRRKGIEK